MKTTLYWLAILASGTLFGLGLSISSMIQPEVILSFLRFEDFGLFLVLGGATGLTMIFYQYAPGFLKKPLLAEQFKQKPITPMKRTLFGALIFGIG